MPEYDEYTAKRTDFVNIANAIRDLAELPNEEGNKQLLTFPDQFISNIENNTFDKTTCTVTVYNDQPITPGNKELFNRVVLDIPEQEITAKYNKTTYTADQGKVLKSVTVDLPDDIYSSWPYYINVPDDDKFHVFIKVDERCKVVEDNQVFYNMAIPFVYSTTGDFYINWDDGNIIHYRKSELTNRCEHNYAQVGNYHVTIYADQESTSTTYFSWGAFNSADYWKKIYIYRIEVGSSLPLVRNASSGYSNVRVNISGLYDIRVRNNGFFIVPNNFNYVPEISNCYNISKIKLPDDFGFELPASWFQSVYPEKIVMPITYLGVSQVVPLYQSFGNRLANDTKFYVPDNLVNNYKSAPNWIDIADRIYPISQLGEIIQ